ncbi:unnamed protein product [Moneuplotes crassus]|uniref:Uncharacterized protein n=1 Tax=Euplotes crassus TaxID=5936 RepID=A0AAD1U4V1_EUPCR|nr:unnamed protein product [Moneuplotes crassus]
MLEQGERENSENLSFLVFGNQNFEQFEFTLGSRKIETRNNSQKMELEQIKYTEEKKEKLTGESKDNDEPFTLKKEGENVLDSERILSNWLIFLTEGETPSRRAYHSSFIYQDHLYIHGGHDIREGTMSCLWRIDISHKNKEPKWEKIENFPNKNSPGKIAYHTITVVGTTAYLIGGSSQGVDSMIDYTLDLETFNWTKVKRDKNSPISIDEHSSTLVDNDIYIFGGNVAGFRSAEMYTFNITNYKWKHIKPDNKGPCARSSHSCVHSDGKLYIYGGKDEDTNKLNDLWEFDLKTQTWKEITITQDVPLSRSGHSATVYKNFMIIFGGIHELTQELNDLEAFDLKSKKWYSVIEEKCSPTHSNLLNGGFSPDRKSIANMVPSPYNKTIANNRRVHTQEDEESKGKSFMLSVQKTASRNRSRQQNLTISNYGKNLTLTQLEKKVKEKRRAQEHISEETLLTSPTSLSMKNSFLIKTAGKAFDNYAHQVQKRNRKKHSFNLNSNNLPDYSASYNNLGSGQAYEKSMGKVEASLPKPRDGLSGNIYNDRYLVIFGGDRHHVPFNDLYTLDLAKEM